MKRTTFTCSVGALLVAGAAVVVPTQASALETGRHAPSVEVPAVHHATTKSAHRTADETKQVVAAIRASKMLGAVKPSNVVVSKVKFTGAKHTWAGAVATPKNGQTDPAQVLLKKSAAGWTVRSLGTAQVGCGIAPQSVRSALGLHGPC